MVEAAVAAAGAGAAAEGVVVEAEDVESDEGSDADGWPLALPLLFAWLAVAEAGMVVSAAPALMPEDVASAAAARELPELWSVI